MSDVNTPVHNADEQAARVLRVLNEAMADGASSAGALAHVMEELADYAQGFPVLTHNPVRVKSQEYAVTAARLGAIAAELRGLAREQSPPPAPTEEQAAAILQVFDQAMQDTNDRIYALKEVIHHLRDSAESYHTNEGKYYAVDEDKLKSICRGLRRLEVKQSPPHAPTNEQAAPVPILIPLNGLPEGDRDRYGCCWFGIRIGRGLKYWRWTFESFTTSRASSLGYTHYLPHNTPPTP